MTATSPSSTELAAAATSYAALGWPVLPLHPRAKEPLTRRGVLQATDLTDQIDFWWTATPDANIGLRTGLIFDVLDIDGPEGLASLRRIAPDYKHSGPVGSTGKGFHLFFASTGRPNFSNPLGNGSQHPGLDFRGQNGYVVAAPSIHPTGRRYHWARPVTLPLPEAPAWLLDLWPTSSHGPARPSNWNPGAVGSLNLLDELESLGARLRPYGTNRMRGACPFHKDDTPSLIVYLATDSFYCFGCTAWGDALNVRTFKATGSLR